MFDKMAAAWVRCMARYTDTDSTTDAENTRPEMRHLPDPPMGPRGPLELPKNPNLAPGSLNVPQVAENTVLN